MMRIKKKICYKSKITQQKKEGLGIQLLIGVINYETF